MKKQGPAGKIPAIPPLLALAAFVLLSVAAGAEETTVYVTNTGQKYHREDCASLRRSKIALRLEDALKAGYGPCTLCNAPVSETLALSSLYRVNAAGLRGTAQADLSRMIRAEVVGHVDGDTLRVRIDEAPPGLESLETIRMIGVDTPETVHPRREVEFFGREASEFTRQRLLGKSVFLAFDWDLRDRYGRLLAYIYDSGGDCHNAALIREGYAHAYTAYAFQFMDEFRALEQEARRQRRGLWGD
jgi:micrococcal nuclease